MASESSRSKSRRPKAQRVLSPHSFSPIAPPGAGARQSKSISLSSIHAPPPTVHDIAAESKLAPSISLRPTDAARMAELRKLRTQTTYSAPASPTISLSPAPVVAKTDETKIPSLPPQPKPMTYSPPSPAAVFAPSVASPKLPALLSVQPAAQPAVKPPILQPEKKVQSIPSPPAAPKPPAVAPKPQAPPQQPISPQTPISPTPAPASIQNTLPQDISTSTPAASSAIPGATYVYSAKAAYSTFPTSAEKPVEKSTVPSAARLPSPANNSPAPSAYSALSPRLLVLIVILVSLLVILGLLLMRSKP